MARILFAWQLGGGMGHLMQMLPLAHGLVRRGQNVFVAFKNLPRAASIYGETGVHFVQAPNTAARRRRFPRAVSIAHVLGNTGFGERLDLFALASAWRNLFRMVRPDLIVFDHTPIGMLAARGLPSRRALIGTGFFCPPNIHPLPIVRTRRYIKSHRAAADPEKIAADEGVVLENANWMLSQWKQPPMQRLGQLYGEVDERFLTTFKELDHCPNRPTAPRYWGPVNGSGGDQPNWPESCGKRVFAYLKPFPLLEQLLQSLRQRGCPTLVFCDSVRPESRARFECETLRFQTGRADPAIIARECDMAIMNGTHGTLCDMLLAGKPTLQIPLYGEQEMIAEAVCSLGAGEWLSPRTATSQEIDASLDRLLTRSRYTEAARSFADRYKDFDPTRQRAEMLDRALQLLGQNTRANPPRASAPSSQSWVGVPQSWEG